MVENIQNYQKTGLPTGPAPVGIENSLGIMPLVDGSGNPNPLQWRLLFGEWNPQSGDVSSTLPLGGDILVRPRSLDPAHGTGDGFVLISDLQLKRTDGLSLRAGGLNNNCTFGLNPSGFKSSAPCAHVLWAQAVIVPAGWEVVLRAVGNGVETQNVKLYGIIEPMSQ